MDENTRTLLTQILNVPGFRTFLQNDPVHALEQIGIYVNPNDLPTAPLSLPRDEDIQAILVLDPNWDHIQGCMSVHHAIDWLSQ